MNRSSSKPGPSPFPAAPLSPAVAPPVKGHRAPAASAGAVEASPAAPDPADLDAQPAAAPPPRLLDRLREAIRVRHYSIRTEAAYVDWARRFIIFHDKRHPLQMGPAEVGAFLTHLAVQRNVAPATQSQAKSALLFLYRVVLEVQLPWLDEIVAA